MRAVSALAGSKPATSADPRSSPVCEAESSFKDIFEVSIEDDLLREEIAVRSLDP